MNNTRVMNSEWTNSLNILQSFEDTGGQGEATTLKYSALSEKGLDHRWTHTLNLK